MAVQTVALSVVCSAAPMDVMSVAWKDVSLAERSVVSMAATMVGCTTPREHRSGRREEKNDEGMWIK